MKNVINVSKIQSISIACVPKDGQKDHRMQCSLVFQFQLQEGLEIQRGPSTQYHLVAATMSVVLYSDEL